MVLNRVFLLGKTLNPSVVGTTAIVALDAPKIKYYNIRYRVVISFTNFES